MPVEVGVGADATAIVRDLRPDAVEEVKAASGSNLRATQRDAANRSLMRNLIGGAVLRLEPSTLWTASGRRHPDARGLQLSGVRQPGEIEQARTKGERSAQTARMIRTS